jgi:hypothetical protein
VLANLVTDNAQDGKLANGEMRSELRRQWS